jgi:hypothetical protein
MPALSKRPRQLSVAVCLLAVLAASAAEPLPDPDNGALSGTFYFPDSTEGASLVPKGRHAFSMYAITSSHSTNEDNGEEMLTLDGETTRVEFRYRYGISERLEIGVRLPYVWHESGSLDSFVESWHQAFGLPSGSRVRREEDQLEFSYLDTTGTQFDFQRNSNGVGDLRFIAGWRLTDGPNHRSALRFGLKLPTGDSDDLHGSGGNVNFVGEPDLLPDRYNEIIGQFSTGAGFQLSDSIELRLQAVARSATHDSSIEILGQDSAWLTFGGNIRLSANYELSLAITEDLNVRAAPDFSFLIGLQYNPASE